MSRQRLIISDWDDVFNRDDGSQPLLETLQRAWETCNAEKCRLRIEIRTHPDGVVGSNNEHNLMTDPTVKTPEEAHAAILQAVRSSPGTGFNGEIRINFYKAGHSNERFTSFTRKVLWQHNIGPDEEYTPRNEGYGMMRRPMRSMMSRDLESRPSSDDDRRSDGDRDDDNRDYDRDRDRDSERDRIRDDDIGGDFDNSVDMLRSRHRGYEPPMMGGYPMNPGYPGPGSSMPIYTAQQMDEVWRHQGIAMSFAFKGFAQMAELNDKILRLAEGISLRFGLPDAPEVAMMKEMKRETNQANAAGPQPPAGGLGGLLPLLNAAMHLVGSGSTGEAVERGVAMATGTPPPEGAASRALIENAGRAVRSIARGRGGPPQPPMRREPHHHHEPDDDGYEDHFRDDSGEDFNDEPRDDYRHDEDDFDASGYDADPPRGGPPDVGGMSPDEMKALVFRWMDSDPSNKAAVMQMAPELISKVTGS